MLVVTFLCVLVLDTFLVSDTTGLSLQHVTSINNTGKVLKTFCLVTVTLPHSFTCAFSP